MEEEFLHQSTVSRISELTEKKGIVFMNLSEVLAANDYKRVLQHFCEISAIPRGSGYNEKISDWLCGFAKQHGIAYEQDEALNVILRKPASEGYIVIHCSGILLFSIDFKMDALRFLELA